LGVAVHDAMGGWLAPTLASAAAAAVVSVGLAATVAWQPLRGLLRDARRVPAAPLEQVVGVPA
jgi:hypothetical protein